MRKAWRGPLCGLLVGWSSLAGAAEQSKIEVSMQVTGTVSVAADGTVADYALDQRDKLPVEVAQLLDKSLPAFRFEMGARDGSPVQAEMTLQVVALQLGTGRVGLALRKARFDEAVSQPTAHVEVNTRVPMGYPSEALTAGAAGTVYVAVRIDRSGHVVEAKARQVNLRYLAGEWLMSRMRNVLATKAVAGIRQFTFKVPATGPHANDAYFEGVVPVAYLLDGDQPAGYGEWDRYVPGPKQEIAWLDAADGAKADNIETAADGEFALAGADLKLLTPLDGG